MIEIIDYNAPDKLCMGTMRLELDEEYMEISNFCSSGGYISYDYGTAFLGEWDVDEDRLPPELVPYKFEIQEWMNDNVPWGCCGGCI